MELARNRERSRRSRRASLRGWRRIFLRASGWPKRCSPAATCICCARTIRGRQSITATWPSTFPSDKNASAAHWRAGWLNYRLGHYSEAERMFDEQIHNFPGTPETVSALYWRGRLYETQDHNPAQAAANYRTIVRVYQHFFYAQMARQRLAALGSTAGRFGPATRPDQGSADVPDPCRQLSRGQPAPGQGQAARQCRAERIHSAGDCRRSRFGVVERAGRGADLRLLWRGLSRHARAQAGVARRRHARPIESIPLAYWRILFPEP